MEKEINKTIERHPLEPFLPENAKLLMLGSFPPPRARWSMDFYYPNWQNDMWRLYGLLFFGEKNYFVQTGKKAFNPQRLVGFLRKTGVALFDTAVEIIRHKGNASDQFLEVVTPVDLDRLLAKIPACRAIVTTGQKATDTLLAITGAAPPRSAVPAISPTTGERCAYTVCLLPPGLTPSLWKKKRRNTGSCFMN